MRGYIIGSGWKDYQKTGAICGIALPAGLQRGGEAAAADLHAVDQGAGRAARREHPVRGGGAAARARSARRRCARRRSGSTPRRAEYARHARHHHRRHQVRVRHRRGGQALSDRRGAHARLVALLAGGPVPVGISPPSFDKQFVRDWLETQPWNKKPPAPRAARRRAREDRREIPRSAAPADGQGVSSVPPETAAAAAPAAAAAAVPTPPPQPTNVVDADEAASRARSTSCAPAGWSRFPPRRCTASARTPRNPDAVAKIFALKGRPSDHPVIVHLADAAQLAAWAREDARPARASSPQRSGPGR